MVLVVTLETGHFVVTQATADGSFSETIFAPAGTSLLVKVDPEGSRLRSYANSRGNGITDLIPLAGAILRVPEPPSSGPGISFAGAGPTVVNPPSVSPNWTLVGSVTTGALQPGATLGISGTLEVRSPVLSGAGEMRVTIWVDLERLSGSDGSGTAARNQLSSVALTPTGLPIEHPFFPRSRQPDAQQTLTRFGADTARAALNLSLNIPTDLAAGYYRPNMVFSFEGVPLEQSSQPLAQVDRAGRSVRPSLYLPILRVGQPAEPRLFWTLLTDTLSNGTRGARAIEDRSRFSLSPRVLTQSEAFVIPRLDPVTGNLAVYRLEPFCPTLALGVTGAPPNPPLIPLQLPSGSLTARIQRPDGSTAVIGPAPFAQSRLKGPVDRNGSPLGISGFMTDVLELSTMDPRFEVSFSQDGRYVITLEGWVRDIWGNRWNGSGTYEVFVASPLSLDTAVLPGTPFEVGDTLAPGVVITPAVAADVEMRVRLAPNSDPTRMLDRIVRGRANRFGYFFPTSQGIRLDEAGEYRVDVTATFKGAQGNWRMGSRTWGGVVGPRSPLIIAHGQRGVDDQPANRAQWFFRSQTGVTTATGGHVNFPFQSGDVIWAAKSDAHVPNLTFQDPTGALGPRFDPAQAAIGEIWLLCSCRGNLNADAAKAQTWGYGYRSVQRPLVRVREVISEALVGTTYWRFSEHYAGQIGSARTGDLPNDIKFQYGGAVLRGTALPAHTYGIYGSLFVLVPDNDPGGGTRVFPPFQGNGGGPSGGPVMKLKGKDIDLFIHLTGVRPGTVLEPGDNFSIAGAVGPTLPALVSTTVTAPNGSARQFSGRANRVGYYYRPEHDFAVQEPGIYTVDVRVTFDGQTSAGQVSQPFPAGDVLGSANGRFFVYVVPRESAPLAVNLPETAIIAPPAQLDISASAPAGLSLTSGHVTTMMPGFLLQTAGLTSSAGSISYRYDPATLARDFPNLDLNPPADVITISLFGQTTDSAGSVSYAARVLVLHGQELLNPALTRAVGSVASVSAASYSGTTLASESIIAAFGAGLATATQTAATIPLPTELAGTTITVRDSAGIERLAPLFFVAPAQANYQMPPETKAGAATMIITSNNGTVSAGAVQIAAVAPGLFAANANGQGVAAALALRVKADGTQQFEPVSRFDPAQNRFVATPIDLGPATDQVFLILFGTGTRFRSSLSTVSARIGGVDAPVLFVGAQGDFVGLDQINLQIPRSLSGRGEVEIRLTADGQQANPVMVSIK
jgi:uncharacterized protein (TIGR03437 family)